MTFLHKGQTHLIRLLSSLLLVLNGVENTVHMISFMKASIIIKLFIMGIFEHWKKGKVVP